jgi:isoleucyl-tRNA synthetase
MLNDVNPKTSFPNLEHKQIKYWNENNIFEKSVEKNKGNEKFVFFDGPPFANGLPHYGHILAQSLKDAVTRFWNMQGMYTPRTNGWDCHGLPVEYEVEKKLELSGRKDILEMGVGTFNAACRESVFKYTGQWNELFERIARWVDADKTYATLDVNYMESIWWVFKQIWEKDMVVQGYKSMQICPRCATPLSNFEVSQGYKDVTDYSVIVKFELIEEPGTFFLAWTTTPWSTFTTMGLAAGAEIDYVKVAAEDGNYILAKKRVEAIFKDKEHKILEEFKGDAILGKKYKHIFDEYNEHPDVLESEKVFSVCEADYVRDEDGTGIVTINGAYGEIDMESARKHKLPIILNIEMDGHFNDVVEEFAGKFAKGQDRNIGKYLEEKGLLFRGENYRHSYPHCWRCDTPLLNYAMKAWFIKVTEIKEQLIANNKKINWQPGHIKEGRFGKWLENVRDWNISRNRFWGSPIPIWDCEKCEFKECIGSTAELKERAGKLPMRDGEIDLHRPYIDDITMPCTKCDGTMKRIPEVLDCWFESGSMPYAQLHYPFENKEEFEANFPANFIAEGLDQTRGWFYTLHVISTILFDEPAFKNVIVNGILLAADGEKLSKRKRNYPEPSTLFEQKGVDTTRMFLYNSTAALGEDVRFSEQHVDDLLKKFTLTLWNTYSFFVTYAKIDNFQPTHFSALSNSARGASTTTAPSNKLDQWILSELHNLIDEVTDQMKDYNLSKATRPIIQFVDVLSNWYIRRSRRRFWKSENDEAKMEAYQTLYTVLVELSKLLAPFMPFISEEIYTNLTGKESVHLADWPKSNKELINEDLNNEISLTRSVVNMGHALRAKKKIKVRQPLQKVTLGLPQNISAQLIEAQKEVILEELNVKELSLLNGANELAQWVVIPNARALGPKYGKDVQVIIKEAKAGNFTKQEDGTIKVGDFILTEDEVKLAYKGKDGQEIESQNGMVLTLDFVITEELMREGLAREVIRNIQDLRKEAQFKVDDRITCLLQSEGELETAITDFAGKISNETLSDEIRQSGDLEWDIEKDFEIEGMKLKIALRQRT